MYQLGSREERLSPFDSEVHQDTHIRESVSCRSSPDHSSSQSSFPSQGMQSGPNQENRNHPRSFNIRNVIQGIGRTGNRRTEKLNKMVRNQRSATAGRSHWRDTGEGVVTSS